MRQNHCKCKTTFDLSRSLLHFCFLRLQQQVSPKHKQTLLLDQLLNTLSLIRSRLPSTISTTSDYDERRFKTAAPSDGTARLELMLSSAAVRGVPITTVHECEEVSFPKTLDRARIAYRSHRIKRKAWSSSPIRDVMGLFGFYAVCFCFYFLLLFGGCLDGVTCVRVCGVES